MKRTRSLTPVNIGDDDDASIADLVDLICEVAGVSPKIEFDTNKPEGRFRKCADANRLREISDGYQPKVSLREGIEEMTEWYRRSFRKVISSRVEYRSTACLRFREANFG